MMTDIDWSRLYSYRKSNAKRLGDVWDLPVEKRPHTVVLAQKNAPKAVLEMGAGGREMKDRLEKKWPAVQYKSFDIDKQRFHDFYHLADINGEYNYVLMFEVIEHVKPELALEMLVKAYKVLVPGGCLMVTTPNIFYPPGFLRDATHITPWCYDELAGIAELAGFETKVVYRLYHDSFFKKLAKRFIFYPLFRLVGIDYAKQIMLVSTKPLTD